MKIHYLFLPLILLCLVFCDNANNKKNDLVNQDNIYIKIDGQEANFFPVASKLRFSAYGNYYISDILLMNSDGEPPVCLFLPKGDAGNIEIIDKGPENSLAVIDFDHRVATRIMNGSWKKMLLKGTEESKQYYCTVYLKIGRN